MVSCRIYFGIPQDIHACLVRDLQVTDLYTVYLFGEMPKQVRHDVALVRL